jgi:hypothetical protein
MNASTALAPTKSVPLQFEVIQGKILKICLIGKLLLKNVPIVGKNLTQQGLANFIAVVSVIIPKILFIWKRNVFIVGNSLIVRIKRQNIAQKNVRKNLTGLKDHLLKNGNHWLNILWREMGINVKHVTRNTIWLSIILLFFPMAERTNMITSKPYVRDAINVPIILTVQNNSVRGGRYQLSEEEWLRSEVSRGNWLRFMGFLASCESGNNPLAVNPHDNGSPSYGLYQYKRATWINQIRKYGYLKNAEDNELMNFIYDREWQDKITLLTLQDGGINNWKNCYNKSVVADIF